MNDLILDSTAPVCFDRTHPRGGDQPDSGASAFERVRRECLRVHSLMIVHTRVMLSSRLGLTLSSCMFIGWFLVSEAVLAADRQPLFLWSTPDQGLPVETGRELPRRDDEDPPAVRITDIQQPYLIRYDPRPEKLNGTAVIILPGGGYSYVVSGKEGLEVAQWLNELGITAFVLHYRTPTRAAEQDWLAPVQDAQRAIRLVRQQASTWGLKAERIGLLGFSAGGNAAAIAATNQQIPARLDQATPAELAQVSARPDFLMLAYPWKLIDDAQQGLRNELTIDAQTPPTFLVHTHDDGVTSLSSIMFYQALKQHKIPAELHIYRNGGHGYGVRPVPGSTVHTWTARAADWLNQSGLLQL